MWPEVSPPSTPPVSRSMRQHVAIADRGTLEVDAALAQRQLEPEVAHHGADHRPRQRAAARAGAGDDDTAAGRRRRCGRGDRPSRSRSPSPSSAMPDLRAHAGHRQLQQLRRGRAAADVDVAAVGRAADRHDFGAEIGQHARRHLVGGAVGAVDHDLKPGQVDARPAACRGRTPGTCARDRVDAPRPAEAARGARHRLAGQLRLDLLLELVRELAAARRRRT